MARRRRNPFEEIEEFFDRMSRQFEEGPWSMGTQAIPVDIVDDGDAFVVTADLPGYEREDIDLALANGSLRIRAEREEETATEDETEGGRYIRRERRRQSASRSVSIPGDVDADEVKATYNNGVLTVTLPKATTDGSQRIDIE